MSIQYPVRYRILLEEKEIFEAARLRYEIYGERVPHKNSQRIEFDEYDNYSLFIGGFISENGIEHMIAFLRVVTRTFQPTLAVFIQNIVESCGSEVLKKVIQKAPIYPFPSACEVFRQPSSYPETAKDLVRDFIHHPYTCEVSRAICHPDHRGGGIASGILDFGVALCLELGFYQAVGSTDSTLTPMYRKYGYDTHIQIPQIYNHSVNYPSDVILADFRRLPEPAHTNVSRLLQERCAVV